MNLQGKVAFITGATKGIGYGIAKAFLEQGMLVAITGRTSATVIEAVNNLNATGNDATHAIGITADVSDFESMLKAQKEVVTTFGKIDVVIANAGVGHFVAIQDMTLDQWSETINTNLTGVFYSLKTCVNELIKNKGYFITISSLAGTNFFAKGAAYNASKFGVTGFTQAAMLDLRAQGVKVTTIMPGSVATHFNGHTPNEKDGWKIQIEDLGQMAVDLLKMNPRTLPSKIEVRPAMTNN